MSERNALLARTKTDREAVIRRAVLDGRMTNAWDEEDRELAVLIAKQLLQESYQFFNAAVADVERYGRYIADARLFFAHNPPPPSSGREGGADV